MFLLGLEVVFISYAGTRIYEKVWDKPDKKIIKDKKLLIEKKSLKIDEVVENGKREKDLHYMKASGVSFVLSGLVTVNPIFLPPMLATFAYISIPYLRHVENSILKKKKIDGYVLYGIADMMTLGLGYLKTASFAIGLVHTAHFVISNAEERSKKSLANIFTKQPNKVWLLINDIEIETALKDIKKGDVIVVTTGDIIPVDGVIVKGIASVDQHALTGESQPAEKNIGDNVFASTQVMSGSINIEVQKSGDDTTVSKITEVLNNSIDFKTNSQLKGEQWADSWNLPVLALAMGVIPFLGPVASVVILNGHIAQNIRIVAPLSTLNYLNLASHKGILVKDGRVLEDLSTIDTFLFDKTGTLTSEEPEIGRILVFSNEYSQTDILTYAAAAEGKLKHPIARAILNHAEKEGINIPKVDDSDYIMGYGITVKIDNKLIQVGSHRFMDKEGIKIPTDLDEEMHSAYEAGHSLIMVAIDKKFSGVLEMRASVRPEVKELLKNLRQNGVKHIAIVSGDHQQPTQKLAKDLGMDDYFYDVLPENKAEIVEKLKAEGRKVCFIGDGVNDTIAMKKANISISLSGATSVATDTAQIILMDGSLIHLTELLKISHDLNRNLQKGWLFNIVPGISTIFYAFTPHLTIATALLISQTGLGAGILNAMSPLKETKLLTNKKQVNLINKDINYGK